MILLMAKATTKKKHRKYFIPLTQITRTIYFFVLFYAGSIIVFDSGNLIERAQIIDRWIGLSVLLFVNTIVWYVAGNHLHTRSKHTFATFALAATVLGLAGFTTYWERGMASTSTILYVLPLLIVATLKHRHALLATTTLSAGTYAMSTVIYFNTFFNEGFRIQLWGTMLITTGSIFAAAWLIMVVTGLRSDDV